MKIAVLGTGIVGRTLAAKLAGLHQDVTIGTRNVAQTLANQQNDGYGNPPFSVWHKDNTAVKLASYAEATADAEIILNATSGQSSIAALKEAGEQNLKGKVLLDIANPLDFSNGMPPSLSPVNTDSLGEQIQRTFPEAKVVKTLNTMNAFLMVNPTLVAGEHNVFVSGNDAGAKQTAKELLKSFGWPDSQIIDLGDISTARGVEMLLPLWLRLWGALGTVNFNFHIQR